MGYDGGDSFPFNFELNGIPFGSKSKGKLSPPSYLIQFHYTEKTIFSFPFKLNGTVLLLILNQIEFHLVQNRKENCHHDHIPFNVKGNGNIVFSA